MKSYRVVYELGEGGHWIARTPKVKGCHTYGRSLSEARARIREALGLFADDVDDADLVDDVRLPADMRCTRRFLAFPGPAVGSPWVCAGVPSLARRPVVKSRRRSSPGTSEACLQGRSRNGHIIIASSARPISDDPSRLPRHTSLGGTALCGLTTPRFEYLASLCSCRSKPT